ncbi:unnamed protein product [Amaranthus hypochondriacus]
MSSQLEIQPRELKFVVELNKQSKCTIRLVNKTDQWLAFKVKTTSPKKYCVRPNVGVFQPKSVHEFVVIMQAIKTAPVDLTCKDKFLVQSTIVPEGTLEEHITSEMFAKDGVKLVEDIKMRVSLVMAPSDFLEPTINGMLKQADAHIESKIINNGDLNQVKDADVAPIQDVKAEPIKQVKFEPIRDVDLSMQKGVESELTKEQELVTRNNEESKLINSKTSMSDEEQRLFLDVEEMKSKLHELESKLSKAEMTISNLTEDKWLIIQEREKLKQEMTFLKTRKVERRVQDGFPLLFVCMVALISLIAGYGFHP